MVRIFSLLAVWVCFETCAWADSRELLYLDQIAPPKSQDGELVEDVRMFLLAREEKGPEAYQVWAKAAVSAQKPLIGMVLTEWSQFLLQQNMTPDQVVVRILKDTKNGSLSAAMRAKSLRHRTKLKEYLARLGVFSEYKAVKKVPSPWSDPSLSKAATLWCQNQGEAAKLWAGWEKELTTEQLPYWQLLKGRCQSVEGFEKDMRLFVKKPGLSPGLRLVVTRQLAVTQRQLGQRSQVWKTYDQLLEAWKSVRPTSSKALLQRIDDHLWAARYHSFVGQYEQGRQIALKTTTLIAKAQRKMDTKSRRRKLKNLAAETLHIQSFRIAVGQKKYLAGAQMIRQQKSKLPRSWQQRFSWYEGLLYYLAKKPQESLKAWEKLESKVTGRMRPKILFWLARVTHELKQKKSSEIYREKLAKESPFSFYHVVALKQAGLSTTSLPVTEIATTEPSLRDQVLEKHSWVGPVWRKSQLLLQAGLFDVAKPYIKECDRRIRKRFGVGRFMGQYVQLSRMHHKVGNFRQAIALNADLSGVKKGYWQTWPDQVSVFFPRPYFHQWAQSNVDAPSVPTETLMAIARQESAFDSQAVSPANAFGLLQLTVHTARQMSQSELADHELAQQLLEPEFNIQLGATYVESLRKRYQAWPYVFAAYNAGELAVDTWLAHRPHADMLTWLELIPFGETRRYAMAVWRNQEVYQKHLPELSYVRKKGKRVLKDRTERPLRERYL